MKKIFVLEAALLLCVIMCSCGHNCLNYGDGIGFDAGINPENWTASFTLRYGKILTAVTRDNVEIELTGNADAKGSAGTEKTGLSGVVTDGALKVKIGRQINGAAVDLVKAGAPAERVIEALSKPESQSNQHPPERGDEKTK